MAKEAPGCPSCGARVFNRRYPKCEFCGAKLPDSHSLHCGRGSALQKADEDAERVEPMPGPRNAESMAGPTASTQAAVRMVSTLVAAATK